MTEFFFPYIWMYKFFYCFFYGLRRSLLMSFEARSTLPLSIYPLPLPFRSYFLAVSLRAILLNTENLFIGYFHGFRFAQWRLRGCINQAFLVKNCCWTCSSRRIRFEKRLSYLLIKLFLHIAMLLHILRSYNSLTQVRLLASQRPLVNVKTTSFLKVFIFPKCSTE